MKVILFGATGMVGSGVLIECLDDPRVTSVLGVTRRPLGRQHPKLRELAPVDFFDYASVRESLTGYDACFFCLGVSSFRMSEDDYRRMTYDLTLAAAGALAEVNPGMVFCYVSGQGTDSTEKGRSMWARVKGRTENALLAMPFDAYMFRPGFIQPLKGVRSKTPIYQGAYVTMGWLFPLLERLFPRQMTTTEKVGRAMIAVAAHGAPKRILDPGDINGLAGGAVGE